MNSHDERRVWSTTRAEALSDAVFAIVMTLLVLELKVPNLPRHAPASAVWHGVEALGPVFFSYFVTFVLAGAFWFRHHVAFHELTHIDGPLFALNLAFLSFVSLLPFSTAMLGSFSLAQPISLGCYFANLLALAVTLTALWFYANRAGLLEPARDPLARRRFAINLAVQPIACVAALAVIAFEPHQAMLAYVLVVAVGIGVARRWTRARSRRHRATAHP